jgi:hypothetical protein
MADAQLDVQPAPSPARQSRRRPASPTPAASTEAPPVAPTVEDAATTARSPEPTVAAHAAPVPDVVAQPAPAAEPPTAPARRGGRPAIALPELALPGVSSADIRAELARRERRMAKLLAERERVTAAMDEIEAALEAIGQ